MQTDKPLHLLISGATGYIGKHLVSLADKEGFLITILSRKPLTNPQFKVIPYQLEDALPDIPDNIDVILHLAADLTGESISEKQEIDAARRLIDCGNNRTRFIFVSSNTANANAPTRYGRVKWSIEQIVAKQGGIIVRPGLVYGGNPGSVYKTLILLTKSSIMLPSFFPTVYVQPISVEDICKALLRLAVKPDLVQKEFNIAAHKPISFSKFLKELAWRRLHRLRFFIPFPAFILQILLGAGSLFSANVMNLSVRFRSLLQTPYIATETSLDILDMELSDLPEGFWLNRTAGRRQLLEEGRAILRYVSGRAPSPSMISRYVKAIELSKDSKALGLQNIVLTFPKLLYLLEGRGIIKRPTVFKELERRLDFALVLAEASVDNIDDFILHKSVSKIKVILLIFWVLSKEILMQMIRPLISLVLRWFIK